ncbi:MAG: FAD-dependent oxidoreductase [Hyphomicrobiaceae bacterium]|nr:FAD-dependent oxidoreductase [Hyphomicrobiaceae bacterium]
MQKPSTGANGAFVHEEGRAGTGPREEIQADLCIIGAGSGGLSLAAGTAQLGLKVVLIERGRMGGDCLNYGCVPSKAMIAAGRRAQLMRTSAPFGVQPVDPRIDHRRVHAHVQEVIAAIAPNDSVERFTGLGVRVIQAHGAFVDKSTVKAGNTLIRARRFCIATGSSPLVPPIPGLDAAPHFTNETVFENDQPLAHLIVIGGGPIGMELAQAHLRLGSRVTVLEGMKALGKDDPELAEVVLHKLRGEGLDIREAAKVERIESRMGAVKVHVAGPNGPEAIEGTHILVATGRKANVDGLNLEAAGIAYDRRGIKVGPTLTTSNSKVYAIGDVTGGLQFTHVANYHAGIVLKRLCFRLPAKAGTDQVPWVTYTDPELANVGLTEDEARKRHGTVNVYRWPYHENDRAQAERATEGFVKVVTDKKDRILGAAIVGEHAGELIQMWSLALSKSMKITDMAQWISPYPTLSEVNKRAALRYYASKAGSPLVRNLVSFLSRLGG